MGDGAGSAYCYHGTTLDCARKILAQGFNADSWFAQHMEDAVAYGGPYVFQVVFDASGLPIGDDGMPCWQFHVPASVSSRAIRKYWHVETIVLFNDGAVQAHPAGTDVEERTDG